MKNKPMTVERAWALISQMNWNMKADSSAMAKVWWKQLRKETMVQLRSFVDARASDLYKAVERYENEHGGELEVGSDDGFSDLRYHVVGLGHKEFETALNNPAVLQERYRKHDYKESFSYVFLEPDPPRTNEEKETSIRLLKKNLADVEKQVRELEHQLLIARGTLQDVLMLWGQVESDLQNEKETA